MMTTDARELPRSNAERTRMALNLKGAGTTSKGSMIKMGGGSTTMMMEFLSQKSTLKMDQMAGGKTSMERRTKSKEEDSSMKMKVQTHREEKSTIMTRVIPRKPGDTTKSYQTERKRFLWMTQPLGMKAQKEKVLKAVKRALTLDLSLEKTQNQPQ
jgi:hypothetical protein